MQFLKLRDPKLDARLATHNLTMLKRKFKCKVFNNVLYILFEIEICSCMYSVHSRITNAKICQVVINVTKLTMAALLMMMMMITKNKQPNKQTKTKTTL